MEIISQIQLDMVQRGMTPKIHAKTGDTARAVAISVTKDGAEWEVPADATAIVRYRKGDGTSGLYDALPDGTGAVSASGNVLTVRLAPQVLTCPGLVRCDVVLVQGAAVLATFDFHILVEPSPESGIDTSSQDYYAVRTLAELNAALAACVRSVNGVGPDENGDVALDAVVGPQGPKGDTPVKGVDYFTEEDKQEMVQAVLAALPSGDEVYY